MKGRLFVLSLVLASSAAGQLSRSQNPLHESSSVNLPDVFDLPVAQPYGDARNGVRGGAFVGVADLAVPSRARKLLDQANELMRKRDMEQALQKLKDAVSIYPAFAVAYNNMGVIYSQLGDPARARNALESAVSLNDHFALAHLNLGRISLAAGDFAAAEASLDKASRFGPANPMTLVLLSYAEYMNGSFDEAIATSHVAHALDKPHALVHRMAASAFERKNQAANAIAELELFLKEEPSGAGADAARKELKDVSAVLR